MTLLGKENDALGELKAGIERLLVERCGISVDFDAEDALRRLLAGGLVRADAEGRLTVIALADAREHLDRLSDRLLDVDRLDEAARAHGGA